MTYTKRFLSLFLLSLVSVLAIGCGSSSDDFALLSNNGQANTGNLQFRFQRATPQTTTVVGANTVTLRFNLYSTNPPTPQSLILTEDHPFAELIVLTNVPANLAFVEVLALDANGFPVTEFETATGVAVGDTTEVDLGTGQALNLLSINVTPDPVDVTPDSPVQLTVTGNFDNGSSFPVPFNENLTFDVQLVNGDVLANISSSGLVTNDITFINAGRNFCGGNTVATATYNLNGMNFSDNFTINSRCLLIVQTLNQVPSGVSFFGPGFGFNLVGYAGGLPNDAFEPLGDDLGGPFESLESPPYVFDYFAVFIDKDGQEYQDGDVVFFGPDGEDISIFPQVTFALAEPLVSGIAMDPNSGLVTVDAGVPHLTEFAATATWTDTTRAGATGFTYTVNLRGIVLDPSNSNFLNDFFLFSFPFFL